ncbi:MAG: glycosyltransferase [Nitrososphaeria archaeon]
MLKIFIRYSKLLSITRNLRETLSLSVSFSIPFELKIFDPKLDIKVLNPSLGVDEAVYYTKACDIDFDAIYFARLHPLKGLFDIPLIWKKVVEVKPYAKLIVAGSWQNKIYEYEFYKLCRKLNLLNNIKYVGFLPKEILYSYVKSAKVLLYPSYLDSFPLTVLETLACGIPVIACNINPIRLTYRTDAVIKVYTNDLNKFAENVITVLEDEALRKKLSQNALAFASKYDWDSAAKEEFNSIQTILNYWAGK